MNNQFDEASANSRDATDGHSYEIIDYMDIKRMDHVTWKL